MSGYISSSIYDKVSHIALYGYADTYSNCLGDVGVVSRCIYILSHEWHVSIVTCTNIHRVLSQYRVHIRLLSYGDDTRPLCNPDVKKLRGRFHVLNAKLRMKQRLHMDSHILTRRFEQDIMKQRQLSGQCETQ